MVTTATANSRSKKQTAASETHGANIEERVDSIRKEIAALTKTVTEIGAKTASDYTKRANRTAGDLAEAGEEALELVSKEFETLERKVGRKIRRHPLQSVAIAAGFGLLVALLVRR